jgi:hypothetical protein
VVLHRRVQLLQLRQAHVLLGVAVGARVMA